MQKHLPESERMYLESTSDSDLHLTIDSRLDIFYLKSLLGWRRWCFWLMHLPFVDRADTWREGTIQFYPNVLLRLSMIRESPPLGSNPIEYHLERLDCRLATKTLTILLDDPMKDHIVEYPDLHMTPLDLHHSAQETYYNKLGVAEIEKWMAKKNGQVLLQAMKVLWNFSLRDSGEQTAVHKQWPISRKLLVRPSQINNEGNSAWNNHQGFETG